MSKNTEGCPNSCQSHFKSLEGWCGLLRIDGLCGGLQRECSLVGGLLMDVKDCRGLLAVAESYGGYPLDLLEEC